MPKRVKRRSLDAKERSNIIRQKAKPKVTEKSKEVKNPHPLDVPRESIGLSKNSSKGTTLRQRMLGKSGRAYRTRFIAEGVASQVLDEKNSFSQDYTGTLKSIHDSDLPLTTIYELMVLSIIMGLSFSISIEAVWDVLSDLSFVFIAIFGRSGRLFLNLIHEDLIHAFKIFVIAELLWGQTSASYTSVLHKITGLDREVCEYITNKLKLQNNRDLLKALLRCAIRGHDFESLRVKEIYSHCRGTFDWFWKNGSCKIKRALVAEVNNHGKTSKKVLKLRTKMKELQKSNDQANNIVLALSKDLDDTFEVLKTKDQMISQMREQLNVCRRENQILKNYYAKKNLLGSE